jgi:hypothetical protein
MVDKYWIVDEWRGCYPSNWKGTVVAEAMTHPAKFSSRLIRRIYEHITAEGWVQAGDGVIDPFGGVGLGALDAMRLGLHWTGVELEEKFWKIGQENISLWNSRFGSMPRWGTARLVNGDSRKLLEVITPSPTLPHFEGREIGEGVVVSSPPYDETRVDPGNVGNAIINNWGKGISLGSNEGYGQSEGQIGGADDFWMAARVIVEQVYEALESGGHACWVVKDYVKAKQVVPFSDQWRQLCEAVGFETLHEHRAMLVHHKGKQGMLDGGVHEVKTESKSFFRRLAEKKGSPRIDWEVVWCMRKP